MKTVQLRKLSRSREEETAMVRRWKCRGRDRGAENKRERQSGNKTSSLSSGDETKEEIRAKRRWGGEKRGERERAVWLIETESTDRKSLSCHWAERQSLFILLTTSLCSSALSPGSSLCHLPASFTHSPTHGGNSSPTGNYSQKELLSSLGIH